MTSRFVSLVYLFFSCFMLQACTESFILKTVSFLEAISMRDYWYLKQSRATFETCCSTAGASQVLQWNQAVNQSEAESGG